MGADLGVGQSSLRKRFWPNSAELTFVLQECEG